MFAGVSFPNLVGVIPNHLTLFSFFRCEVRRLELYSFRRPGVVSGQHSLILFKSEYGYTVLGCFALHLKDIVIFQEILKMVKKRALLCPNF